MKKRFYLLFMGFAFFGIIGGSCTKDNVQPANAKKQSLAYSNPQPAADSGTPAESVPASDAPSTGGCPHGH